MISVEVKKIRRGNPEAGVHPRGVVVEFASDGEARRRQFLAAHLIDTLQGAGLDAAELNTTDADRSTLFVTKPQGVLLVKEVYNVFRESENIEVCPLSLEA